MPLYNIRGVEVDFPFVAYQCQLICMERIIESLQQGQNALLESPTGTGKTLCLLCATLAWRENLIEKDSQGNIPTIIYSSRTHSQLTQVIKELKKTRYRPKTSILGSRNQLCIHPKVKALRNTSAQNAMCKVVVSNKTCTLSEGAKSHAVNNNLPAVTDIEDLVQEGTAHSVCPYYLAKELQTTADIIFVPYNYIVDPLIRKTLTVDLKGAVIIFDEAHNLESACTDSSSFEMNIKMFDDCADEIQRFMNAFSNDISFLSTDDPASSRAVFSKLKQSIQKLKSTLQDDKIAELGKTYDGSFLSKIFESVLIEFDLNGADSIEMLERVVASSDNMYSSANNLIKMLKIIFLSGHSRSTVDKWFKVHVEKNKRKDMFLGKEDKRICFWCFHPGLAMEDIVKCGVRNLILASGTLSPLETFAKELSLPCPIRLENTHIVGANQVWVGVLKTGPDGTALNSNFANRTSNTYLLSLGNLIVNVCQRVPDGVLVFFPSYSMLNDCLRAWKTPNKDLDTVWDNICKNKHPVEEPPTSKLFSEAMEDFYSKIRDTSRTGAVFFAVCRGKVSEGLDFADRNGRAVVIIGIPNPNDMDPKVTLKKKHLDDIKQKTNDKAALTGGVWYRQCALRAVNQAVGRVIRHRFDHGAIILADERFEFRNNEISKWLRPHVKVFDKFSMAIGSLIKFFKNIKQVEEQWNSESRTPAIDIQSTTESKNVARESLFNRYNQLKNENNKKTIVITPKNESNKTTVTSEPSTQSKNFALKLKQSLTTEEYLNLRKILTNFKNNANMLVLVEDLIKLLEANEEKKSLIFQIENFLPPTHKKQFSDALAKRISSKKRKLPDGAEEGKNKRVKVGDNVK